ncbi:MAG: hypothetical protein J3R72DRAFT_446518 [Linnemannia gamsii]|nr:MAG: hypothetical protein J3R72DRAFT_446518 [Linnemannia gamsii]
MITIDDLPSDVLVYLTTFLYKQDIPNIVLTCRLFHQHYAFLRWKDISIHFEGDKKSTLDAGTLRAHAKWVHSLKFIGTLPAEYFDISFPNLRALFKGDLYKSPDTTRLLTRTLQEATALAATEALAAAEQDLHWARLVTLNPSIQEITIAMGHDKSEWRKLWSAVSTSLHNPKRLCIVGFGTPNMYDEGARIFWKAVSRFEVFDCTSRDQLSSFPYPRSPTTTIQEKEAVFSRMKKISYQSSYSMPMFPEKHLEFFKRCRNLKTLSWKRRRGHIPTSDFTQCLERQQWPHMENLSVSGIIASDEDLATIIHHLPPLKHLEIGSGDFGPLCFRHLRERLLGSLKTLDLSKCDKFTGQMALEVMSSCPQLEEFGAPYITIQDLRTAPRPWVCLGLKRLKAPFIDDNYESNTVYGDDLRNSVTSRSSSVVFGHLSKLEKLDTLDISFNNVRSLRALGFVKLNAPQFRLDTGLRRLATLKRLKELYLDHTKQDLRKEDVECMLMQWPMLKKVSGTLGGPGGAGGENSAANKQLSGLMKAKGICRVYYSQVWAWE